jgi:hypothetical protein
LHEFSLTGKILPRTENNKYLKASYKGNGSDISEKWNVKIYTSGSIVTTDTKTLKDIINGTFQAPDTSLKVIQIDDAGFGSPVCGVMIGVTDGNELWTDTVDVKLFQGDAYEKREYLKVYTEKGLSIIAKQGISPKIHRIEICSGFINQMLKEKLREHGFQVIITDIKGLLQDSLEDLYKSHVRDLTGHDLGYDPKELSKSQIASKYHYTVKWAQDNAPHLLKTGWKALQ